jgi:hypothetical protein
MDLTFDLRQAKSHNLGIVFSFNDVNLSNFRHEIIETMFKGQLEVLEKNRCDIRDLDSMYLYFTFNK